jgi:hypothetical protein
MKFNKISHARAERPEAAQNVFIRAGAFIYVALRRSPVKRARRES